MRITLKSELRTYKCFSFQFPGIWCDLFQILYGTNSVTDLIPSHALTSCKILEAGQTPGIEQLLTLQVILLCKAVVIFLLKLHFSVMLQSYIE